MYKNGEHSVDEDMHDDCCEMLEEALEHAESAGYPDHFKEVLKGLIDECHEYDSDEEMEEDMSEEKEMKDEEMEEEKNDEEPMDLIINFVKSKNDKTSKESEESKEKEY